MIPQTPEERDALAAAERGHIVTLYEATGEIGGQLRLAARIPGKEDYAQALREAGVEVRHTTYRGAPHGYQTLPGLAPAAQPALEELIGEIAHHLHEENP